MKERWLAFMQCLLQCIEEFENEPNDKLEFWFCNKEAPGHSNDDEIQFLLLQLCARPLNVGSLLLRIARLQWHTSEGGVQNLWPLLQIPASALGLFLPIPVHTRGHPWIYVTWDPSLHFLTPHMRTMTTLPIIFMKGIRTILHECTVSKPWLSRSIRAKSSVGPNQK